MRELKTIEMHTCGEPARIVIDGMPELRGSTMQEKEQDMREHYDNLRTAIIQEPRGHQNRASVSSITCLPWVENSGRTLSKAVSPSWESRMERRNFRHSAQPGIRSHASSTLARDESGSDRKSVV